MTRTQLDPWRVLRSFLSKVRSYDVPDAIDRAGLCVDWTLSEKQDYSHGTRWAAYRPRIDAAYEALASDDDRLRVSFVVASELAQRGLADEVSKALYEIGWELRDNQLAPSDASVRELFFPTRSQHHAYVEIRTILKEARQSVAIVDPYVDTSSLKLLSSCATSRMTMRLLTSHFPKDFSLEAEKWVSQYRGVTLEVRTTSEFHDRFIIIDDAYCWHVGCSIKDAGNKAFMLSKVEDSGNRDALIKETGRAWDAATVVI